MKKIYFTAILLISAFLVYPQENKYFLKLEAKEFATFSDGISMLRLLFDEKDYTAGFTDNLLWAVDKKLFQVKIPIKPDTINPILNRGELSFWICRVFNGKKGLVNNPLLTRYSAFKVAVSYGIISEGRGITDSISGKELLQIFNYLDNYVREKKIKPGYSGVLAYEEGYDNLPQWREQLYREFSAQRKEEMERLFGKSNSKKTQPQKTRNNLKEKFIDKEDLRITKEPE